MKLMSVSLRAAPLLLLIALGKVGNAAGQAWMEECNSQFTGFMTCVTTELSETEASSCTSCLLDEIDSHVESEGECLTIENELCVSIRRCGPSCGTCTSEEEEWFRCVWDMTQPQCDDLNCDQVFEDYKAQTIAGIVVGGLFLAYIGLRVYMIICRARESRPLPSTELSSVGGSTGRAIV